MSKKNTSSKRNTSVRRVEVQCSVCGETLKVPFMLAQAGWTCKACEKHQEMAGVVDDEWNDRSLEEENDDYYMGTSERDIREMMEGL